MRLEYQIILAFLLDLLFGDPRSLPHPVRLIGRLAIALETPCRKAIRNERLAGLFVAVSVLASAAVAVLLLIRGAALIHPLLADAVSVILIYTSLAARDLAGHGMAVHESLRAEDLPEARRRVGLIVGRDTDNLDEGEIARAAVESIAENTSDGVTAPLFFAFLAGPIGAILYKAVNTLDSTFGYKNDRFLYFGWAAARLDDVVNYLPARLTALTVPLAAALMLRNPLRSFRMILRDAKKHPSPNSGLTEAAFAGAMGIQLGGLNYYFGKPSFRATMGDALKPIERRDIPLACTLMYVTAILFLLIGLFFLSSSYVIMYDFCLN
ncbi:MAG: adenosylcobinamide-phosphate synthase CbiB [Syntrophales bacterium]|nr:adenosylcobinamide-phosphate synthase CbiB [Syntrophales bacterium]